MKATTTWPLWPPRVDHMTTDDVRWLKDQVEITELLARYCDRLDAHDLEGVMATFTDDARTDYGPGRGGDVVGRPAIRERIARGQSVFRRTHHQVGHSTITIDGDRGTGVSAALTGHERFSGEQELLALRYLDDYARVDGQWLISLRRVEISLVQGFAGTEWNWWPRRGPEYPS
jgi:ketosteroid isomerase-like protein